MTKGEIRKARKAARENGQPLTGELAVNETQPQPIVKRYRRTREPRERVASREVQHARYLDCGPQAWDDRD